MTRLLEILISLAIVAALYVVVALVLPSERHLFEKIETNRKLTIVFDSLNSLHRFKAWNPLILRDPRVQLTYSGPDSGVGARMDYVSTNERIGKGSWEITESIPREKVAYKIESRERGSNKRTEFSFRPTGRNNRNVEITQTFDVNYGWDLIGRYAGLYVARNVGDDMKLGLSRLVTMLAAVPNVDYAVAGSGGFRATVFQLRVSSSSSSALMYESAPPALKPLFLSVFISSYSANVTAEEAVFRLLRPMVRRFLLPDTHKTGNTCLLLQCFGMRR